MYTLPKLDYEYNALEPWIDEQTMQIHYLKHHQAYLDKLNTALEQNPDWKNKSLEELCASKNPVIKNNAGGHWNHTFFWSILGGKENKPIQEKIGKNFETFENFQKLFKEAALGRFGSGWAWLTLVGAGKMEITSTANQDVPVGTALLGLDVWEHAYYLKYQNRRAEYIDAFWNVVNWEKVWYIAQNGGVK